MRVRVWDLPLRLCHWLLAAAVITAFVTAKIGGNAMVWHGRAGLAIIGLLVFRIVWGFVGSTHARFTGLIRGSAAIRAHLNGQWRGSGHNPLGSLSVLAMLGLLSAQATTGLFANDDIAYQGHLYPLVGADLSARVTGIHKLFEPLLILLVTLHLGAIAFYTRVRKDDLVWPMITGWKDASDSVIEPSRGGGIVAFILAAAVAGTAVYAASGALLPPPPPPGAAEAPTW